METEYGKKLTDYRKLQDEHWNKLRGEDGVMSSVLCLHPDFRKPRHGDFWGDWVLDAGARKDGPQPDARRGSKENENA